MVLCFKNIALCQYPRNAWGTCAFAICIWIGLLCSSETALKADPIKLFGASETALNKKKDFGQWAEMWGRHYLKPSNRTDQMPTEQHSPQPCAGLMRGHCNRGAWDVFVKDQKALISAGQTIDVTLQAVNDFMNKTRYIIDPINWGIKDFWATLDEFMMKDGDCEDYAISKYVTLKRLGIHMDTMRLVVLQDENLRAAHAVLAVYTDDSAYIMDNQVNDVVPHEQILHYRPVYSLNENGWWLHQRRRFGR